MSDESIPTVLPFALDATLIGVSPRQSIRPATVARSPDGTLALAATVTPGVQTNAVESERDGALDTWNVTASALPRISLALSGARGEPSASAPDLELRSVLGEGGMGRVMLARQHSVGREVAVKTLRDRGAIEHRASLLREARITGGLEHPAIIPVHSLGIDDAGVPVLVMKRVEGVSWRDLIDAPDHSFWKTLLPQLGGRDPLGGHLEILAQVCAALHFAHSKGVIHRDIKPDNVMVGTFGEVYLVDWGIAERLDAGELRVLDGQLVGTPSYMAPEMISGRVGPLGVHTDVYLLGATLHEVLTGSSRHVGNTMMGVLNAALVSAPVVYGDEVPDELAALCNRATARSIQKRPPSALAFRQAILDFQRHRGTSALIASAYDRLETLRALIASETERDAVQIRKLSIECRFAFTQALLEWPENTSARDGLAASLDTLCSYELMRRDLVAARALIAEMSEPPVTLLERLAALDEEIAREKNEAEALLKQAREMDLSVGSASRGLLALVMAVTGICASLFVMPTPEHPITAWRLAEIEVGIIVVLSIVTFVLRRRLLQNRIGRRMILTIFLAMFALLVHRVLGAALGVPIATLLVEDDLLLAAAIAGGAISLQPGLATPALIFAISSVLIAFFPQYASAIFVVTTLLGVLALAGLSFVYERRASTAETRILPPST